MMSKYTALCGLAQEVTALGGRIKYSPNLPYGNHWTEFLSASLHKVIQGGCGLAASNHICNSKSIRPKMAKEKEKMAKEKAKAAKIEGKKALNGLRALARMWEMGEATAIFQLSLLLCS